MFRKIRKAVVAGLTPVAVWGITQLPGIEMTAELEASVSAIVASLVGAAFVYLVRNESA